MRAVLLFLLGVFAWPVQAIDIGDSLGAWTLPDQFDKPFNFDEQVDVLLVASSMDAAKLVDAAIKDQPKGYLEERNIAYVANIQHLPRLVAKMVLVPSMRSANYRILLDREGEVAPRYADNSDGVLWLGLDNGALRDRRRFSSIESLQRALGEVPDDSTAAALPQADPETAR
ncbi:MAG TPA: FAD/FMN-containing dehydrogenase [Pseudomonas xinjiangensis]|uniref:FAD/FMN-containing dehydrogenase n=2 Tax=root TaxID=1 RepID=A0A7V1FRY9_9GAMM|nr:FAD/FMN-containing dehydrogenase [Halopseudomonas xinjiangensis]HEC47300.1 FAD/FMN-containing dehydrogenase [Halopseudomonas xinjiangensis]